MCDLETSRIGAPYIHTYIYDISSLRVKMYHIGGLAAINTNNSMVLWSCSPSALKVESQSSSKQGLISNKTLRFPLLNCVVKMSVMTMYSSDTVNGRVVGWCDHGDEQFGSVQGGSFRNG